MIVFSLGAAISEKEMGHILAHSKEKPSVAPVNFQNMGIKGLLTNGLELSVYSVPPVASYPKGCYIAWGPKKDKLDMGIHARWLPAINLPLFKQITIACSSFIALFAWLIKNHRTKKKVILLNFIYPPYTIPALLLSKLFLCKTCVIITDPVRYTSNYSKKNFVQKAALNCIWGLMDTIKNSFDGYVFLTKHLIGEYNTEKKPYTIVEGFCDEDIFKRIEPPGEKSNNVIMYAGSLTYGFGVDKLVDAFMLLGGVYELWLYGAGDCESHIKKCSVINSRIHYFGKVQRQELLKAEVQADLLVNIKPSTEDYAKYAFPSKILEYMSSGTPVLTTRLGGIPDEYFKYMYSINDESLVGIAKSIKEVLSLSGVELKNKGKAAREYVLENKNHKLQTAKIVKVLEEILHL